MITQRNKVAIWAVSVLLVIWGVAMGTHRLVERSRVTVEKVRAFAESVDLSRLSAADRAKAIDRLATMLNSLPLEERRREREGGDRAGRRWMEQMTDDEKVALIEKTMPTGMKQMIKAFEEMPAEDRQRALDRAMRQLKEQQARGFAGPQGGQPGGAGSPPPVSDELRQKVVRIGLQQLYSQSSAETKAELAPLLEQIQRVMESGAMMRGMPRQ